MIAAVADTHTAIWYIFGAPRLSSAVKDSIEHPAALGNSVEVSPISLAEIIYLVEKRRIPDTAFDRLKSALADPFHVLKEAPLTVASVEALQRIYRACIPDMPDRIIAATAIDLGVPLLSCDGRIRASNVETIL